MIWMLWVVVLVSLILNFILHLRISELKEYIYWWKERTIEQLDQNTIEIDKLKKQSKKEEKTQAFNQLTSKKDGR